MTQNVQLAFDAIQLYQTQYSQVDTVWGYFSVVTLAVSGYVLGSEKATRTFNETLAIVAVYIVFCIGNHKALVTGQRLLYDLSKDAERYAVDANLVTQQFHTLPHTMVGNFHILVVIAVVIGICIVAYSRRGKVNSS